MKNKWYAFNWNCIFIPVIICGMLLTFSTALQGENFIEKNKKWWAHSYNRVSPVKETGKWYAPFKTDTHRNYSSFHVISTFGAPRQSYVKGHIHTGVDLMPRKRSGKYVDVYAMADGVVCSIHLAAPHLTVVVKHRLPGGGELFTSYKHLQAEYVNVGDQVTADTKVGRLFTKKEALALGGRYDHLHLEIRKSFDDYGVASWGTMTQKQLNQRFLDPLPFLKKNLKKN